MGLEVLSEIASAFANIFNGIGSTAKILAWTGVIILLIIALGYIALGLFKAFRAIAYMKVKQFIMMMAVLGILFIVIAAVIP